MPQQLSPYHIIAAEFFIVIKKKLKKALTFYCVIGFSRA